MKKLFTMVAAVLLAAGAYAQDYVLTYSDDAVGTATGTYADPQGGSVENPGTLTCDGVTMYLLKAKKAYDKGGNITVDGESVLTFKLSNGAWNRVDLPNGVTIKAIRFIGYSNNDSETAYISSLGTMADETYTAIYTSDGSGDVLPTKNSCDTITINNVELTGSFYFKNGGKQPCIIMKLYKDALPEESTDDDDDDKGGDSGETTASSNTAPAIWTPADYLVGDSIVPAGTTIVDDGLITMKTVYDAIVDNAKIKDVDGTGMIGGKSFDSFMQVRVDKAPSSGTPAGTEKAGSSPIIITPKANIKFVIYDRRQIKEGSIESNDGKDVLLVNQSAVSTVLAADDFSYVKMNDSYAYSRKSYTLEAGNTYTLYAKGTTMQVYGIAYGPSTIDVTIGSIGYATFGTNALDYAVSGSAYTATVGDTEVTLGDAVTVIPDSVGVILKGDANSTITLTASDEFTSTATSDLIPSDTTLVGNGSYYVLGENDGEAVFGPLKSNVAMKPIKAYFVKENGSAKYNIVEPGEATGISEVGTAVKSGKAYNLQGIEVGDNFKGLYIKNGKKVIK